MNFASDNAGPAAPEIIQALARANEGHAPSYGSDEITARAISRVREVFQAPQAAVYFVSTGTAANALALATLCPPWSTIFCHRRSHIEEDECGAPEFFTGGAKLTLVDGDNGRIDPDALADAISFSNRLGVHNIQRGALSLTNVTELGTIYSPDHIAQLSEIAHGWKLPVHLDGARFANALVATGATPAELTWKAGVDAVCFGGSKNGLMAAEAVVLFDPDRAWEFELRRKRGGHLFSKHRFLSAQFDAYLEDDLWLDLARRANVAADLLSSGLSDAPRARLIYPAEANMVFAEWPRSGHRRAHQEGANYYFWPSDFDLNGDDDEILSARMVCDLSANAADVKAFLALLTTP